MSVTGQAGKRRNTDMMKAKRVVKKCIGGPWDGQRVLVPAEPTMVFRLGEYYGFYDKFAVWNALFQGHLVQRDVLI